MKIKRNYLLSENKKTLKLEQLFYYFLYFKNIVNNFQEIA